MLRLTTLKISLLSALAALFLLAAMLASTGTASAHTASCQPPYCTPHPNLLVSIETPVGPNCKMMDVKGDGFAPGLVALHARTLSFVVIPLHVFPGVVTASGVYGSFFRSVYICGSGFGWWHYKAVLVAIGSDGVQSNPVLV